MLQLPKELILRLAKDWRVWAAAVAVVAIGFAVLHKKPLPPPPTNPSSLHGQAEGNLISAAEHQRQVADYESKAEAARKREAVLQAKLDKLRAELSSSSSHVGNSDPGSGGDTGTAGDAAATESKLREVIDTQDKLIVEVRADRDALKVALVESKLATEMAKAAASKESMARAELEAHVKIVTAQAQVEIRKAEWRGGFKGAAVGIVLRSLF